MTVVSKALFFIGSRMIYEQIKKQSIAGVPFAAHVGVVAVEVGRGMSVARLDTRPHLFNHVGTVHAGAQFALGEAASGLAMAGALAPVILAVKPVAAEAQIRYARPGKGTLTAEGKVREDVDEVMRGLDAEGKVRLNVDVLLKDETGTVISEMSVQWHVRAK
jgi:uncharacterized protein (TIGR00369 family)